MAPPEENWSELNQMLTHHGFPKIEMTNIGKDAIVIDADHGKDLQQTLLRLVKECDRKQSAINDLLERNKRLREELAEQIEFSERCHREVSELQKIVGTKTAEAEKAARQSVSVNTETSLHEDSRAVENKLLHALIAEQDKQIKILQQQITLNENKFVQTDKFDKDKRYKVGLKACQMKLKDAEEKVQLLENEKHILVMELNSRPELHKYRELQQKAKMMTAELKKFQTKLELNKNKRKPGGRLGEFSEKSKAIDSLTSSECRCTLKAICDEMQIYDVDQLVSDIQRLSKLFMSIKKMQKALNDIVMLVNSTSHAQQPFPPLKDKYRAKHAVWCERQWYHVLPTLTTWRNNTISLEALQRELNKWQKLTSDKKESSLFPSPSNQISVAEMTDAVRWLVEDRLMHSPTVAEKQENLVAYRDLYACLQEVFGIKTLSHAVTRIVDIHNQLEELRNMKNTICSLLKLDTSSSSVAVVNEVAVLVQTAERRGVAWQLQNLTIDNIDSKLQEYEELIPNFQKMALDLMDILNVDQLDQVVNAVRDLKSSHVSTI